MLNIVFATFGLIIAIPTAPKKLHTEASASAPLGDIALVLTQVAIALVASVHPFTSITRSISMEKSINIESLPSLRCFSIPYV